MSLTVTQSSPIIPSQTPQAPKQPAKTEQQAPEKNNLSVGDHLMRGAGGAVIGAQATGALAGVGTAAAVIFSKSGAGPFHKALGVIGFGGMAAIAGAVAGGVGGAAATAAGPNASKLKATGYGAIAGGVLGAAAVTALSIATKNIDLKTIAAGAAAGAAAGSVGGFISKVAID